MYIYVRIHTKIYAYVQIYLLIIEVQKPREFLHDLLKALKSLHVLWKRIVEVTVEKEHQG